MKDPFRLDDFRRSKEESMREDFRSFAKQCKMLVDLLEEEGFSHEDAMEVMKQRMGCIEIEF